MSRTRAPVYKSRFLVAGIAFALLGTGNWVAGRVRAWPYLDYLAAHPGPRYSESNPKQHLLEPPDAERERRDIAYAKLDFYGLVESGGRMLILLGGFCLVAGLLRRTHWRPDSLDPSAALDRPRKG